MKLLGIDFLDGVCCRCGAQPSDPGEHAVSHLPERRRLAPRQDPFRVRMDALLRARAGA